MVNNEIKRKGDKIMMTKEKMISIIEDLGNDASLWENPNGTLEITLQDFEGFDDEWNEVDREYDNQNKIDEFFKILDTECISKERDFYTTYHFKNFNVEIGYASYDI